MMTVKWFIDYQGNEIRGKRLENGGIQRNGSGKSSLELEKKNGCARSGFWLPTMRWDLYPLPDRG